LAVSSTRSLLAGRYRLGEQIAVGGTGEVWRAQDELLGRVVAVKLLRPEYAGHAETLARFQAEARHAGQLTHPGIVQVYDYGHNDLAGVPFLVMELIDGPSLAAVMAGGGAQPPSRVLEVIEQVAAGLAAAHAVGLVHRDIKPANLLLAPGGVVKITDFGIASAAGSAPLTQAGMLACTPGYLAPERAAGSPAGPPSDLYSLGIVAWEALAGRPPFTGTALDVALAHAHRALPPLPAAVPAELAALVAGLTARNPAARPSADAAAAQARQQRALTGRNGQFCSWPQAWPRSRAWPPRWPPWRPAPPVSQPRRPGLRRPPRSRLPAPSASTTPSWTASRPRRCSPSCGRPACGPAWRKRPAATCGQGPSSPSSRPDRYQPEPPSRSPPPYRPRATATTTTTAATATTAIKARGELSRPLGIERPRSSVRMPSGRGCGGVCDRSRPFYLDVFSRRLRAGADGS